LIDPKDIKHLVVHHMEPDHSGAMPAVLETIGEHVQVWGHPFAKRLIKSLYGLAPIFQTVKDDTVLKIGGKKLTFRQMPWLHWPECMITYIPEDGFLFGGDIFGSYGIPEGTMMATTCMNSCIWLVNISPLLLDTTSPM